MQISDAFKGKKPEKLVSTSNIDLDALKGIVDDEMHNRTITQEVKKIIAVLVNQDGKNVWKLNCITGDLGIIKLYLDDEKSSILEFEKANLFDFVKRIDNPTKKGNPSGNPPSPPTMPPK